MFSVALWRSCTFTFALSHLRAMAPSCVPAGECHGATETPRRALATETRKHGAYKRTGNTSVSLRLRGQTSPCLRASIAHLRAEHLRAITHALFPAPCSLRSLPPQHRGL